MANTIVALDLGSTHIRAVEATYNRNNSFVINKTFSRPIPAEVMRDGEILSEEELVKALQDFFNEAKFSTKEVLLCSTGEAYEARRVRRLPWSEPRDFKRLLPNYLRDKMPFDVNDYYIDSHTLNEYYDVKNPDDSQRYKEVFMTAVQKSHTDALVKALEKVKHRPVNMDVLPLVLIRAALPSSKAPQNSLVVSIDIGAQVVTVAMHENQQPGYTTSAGLLGGARVTQSITREVQVNGRAINPAEAEMIKQSFSVPENEKADMPPITSTQLDGSQIVLRYTDLTEQTKAAAYQVISREVSALISHINDVLMDALANTHASPFEIILSGGAAELHSLLPRITSEIGIPSRMLNPFENIEVKNLSADALQHPWRYATAVGMLTGYAGNDLRK